MIAWDGNNDSLIEIHTRNISNSNLLSERVMNVLKLYNIGLQYKIVNPGDPATDHKSFWDLNLTAIGINEEYNDDFNPNWHKINDSLSKFNIPYYSKMVQLSIATLMDIALDSNGILSAKEIEYEDPLFIYPNPVEDILFLNLSKSKIKYNSAIITDVTGKKVLNFTDISNLSFLNLSGLNQGTYFLTLISGTQSKKPLKIIKI